MPTKGQHNQSQRIGNLPSMVFVVRWLHVTGPIMRVRCRQRHSQLTIHLGVVADMRWLPASAESDVTHV